MGSSVLDHYSLIYVSVLGEPVAQRYGFSAQDLAQSYDQKVPLVFV